MNTYRKESFSIALLTFLSEERPSLRRSRREDVVPVRLYIGIPSGAYYVPDSYTNSDETHPGFESRMSCQSLHLSLRRLVSLQQTHISARLRPHHLGGPLDQLLRLGLQPDTPIILQLDVRRVNLPPLFILERAQSPKTPSVHHRLVFVPPGTRGGQHLFAGKDGVLR